MGALCCCFTSTREAFSNQIRELEIRIIRLESEHDTEEDMSLKLDIAKQMEILRDAVKVLKRRKYAADTIRVLEDTDILLARNGTTRHEEAVDQRHSGGLGLPPVPVWSPFTKTPKYERVETQ